MLNPCTEKSKKKRKRVEKQQTPMLTINNKVEEEKEGITAKNDGLLLSNPMVQSPQPAIFILDNANPKRGFVKKRIGDEEDVSSIVELPGIPRAPHIQQTSKNGVYFILEKASLSLAYVGKKYQILNPDEHASYLRRKNLNPYDFRPDIVYEALNEIMTSRLRMADRLRGVFIKTDEGILIRVEPQTLIPATFQMFCSMMAELLQKFSIKSKGKKGKLLRLIQNPVTQHLPVDSLKIGLSFSSPKAVKLRDFTTANCDKNLVFVVGAMAHGKIDADYIDDHISVSGYPLSAATCLRSICLALEKNWKIL